jgi:hypothetical protein
MLELRDREAARTVACAIFGAPSVAPAADGFTAELDMARLRTAAKRRSNSKAPLAGVIVGGVFALVGLVCILVTAIPAWNDYRHSKQFATHSALALGMVLTKTRRSTGNVTVLGYTKPIMEYSVRYRFATVTGKQIERTARVTLEEWAVVEERGPIRVRYLPGDPEITHVSGQQSNQGWMEKLIFSLLGSAFTAVGGLILFFILRTR